MKYDYRLIDCFAAGMTRLLQAACGLDNDELMTEWTRLMGIYHALVRGENFDEDRWIQIGIVVSAMDPAERRWKTYGRQFVVRHPLLGMSALVA